MIVETSGGRHQCAQAEQHLDGVRLLDAEGKLRLIIETPGDIKSVEGGEIVIVEKPVTEADRIVQLEEALELLLSGVTE